jgi:hypothetical protein
MTVTHSRPPGRAATTPAQALARARDHLLGLQHADGWWQGELETNVPWTPRTCCCASSSACTTTP